jgi:hypothetical protein
MNEARQARELRVGPRRRLFGRGQHGGVFRQGLVSRGVGQGHGDSLLQRGDAVFVHDRFSVVRLAPPMERRPAGARKSAGGALVVDAEERELLAAYRRQVLETAEPDEARA